MKWRINKTEKNGHKYLTNGYLNARFDRIDVSLTIIWLMKEHRAVMFFDRHNMPVSLQLLLENEANNKQRSNMR